MTNTIQPQNAASVGRTSQIIASALIMGVVVFGVVAYVITRGQEGKMPLIAFLGVGFAAVNTAMRYIVPMIFVNTAKTTLKNIAEPERMSQLASLYQTKTIIGLALLEGAAFLNLIAFIMEKQIWSYGVVAFLLGVMAISFPSQGQFESWAEDMKRDIE